VRGLVVKVKEALLFVNKKKQKNFDFFVGLRPVSHPPEGEQKFFWFFFFKKRTSSDCSRVRPGLGAGA
jgi:hypothetical protein